MLNYTLNETIKDPLNVIEKEILLAFKCILGRDVIANTSSWSESKVVIPE